MRPRMIRGFFIVFKANIFRGGSQDIVNDPHHEHRDDQTGSAVRNKRKGYTGNRN